MPPRSTTAPKVRQAPSRARAAPCWYEIFQYFCPGCSRDWEFRERRLTPKPADRSLRVHYKEQWCGSCY